MRDELVKKLQSLQERKRLMCSRSTKIREIELKRKIIENVLEVMPESSETAVHLRAIESEVNKQDIALRPWKKRKLTTSISSTSETPLPTPIAVNPSHPKDPSLIHADSLRKGTLEWRLNRALESKKIDLAVEISDRIGDSSSSSTVLSNETISSITHKPGESMEKPKYRKPVWLFQAKERWEAKSNM
uniref:Uncharacterized protein n=2 Tax=Trichobilharzia regenti TaxID=157069 RepID=A0AA85K284_TRIRE|nr:unnamed protein product [Trichobilharzia regenti]